MLITREFYIPKDAVLNSLSTKDIKVYSYIAAGKLAARCFIGRTIKPTWSCFFDSKAKLDEVIKKKLQNLILIKNTKNKNL